MDVIKNNNIEIKPIALIKKTQVKEASAFKIFINKLLKGGIKNFIDKKRKMMLRYADNLDFINAGKIKDEIEYCVDYLINMK